MTLFDYWRWLWPYTVRRQRFVIHRQSSKYTMFHEHTSDTHFSEQQHQHPFIPRIYASYRCVYCRYCNGWGCFGGTASIFMHGSYNFYTRMRVDIGVRHTCWHETMPTIHHTTIKWGRSAVSMRGWREGGVYSRHCAGFLLFWCIKNVVIFQTFWYWWYRFQCLGQNNNHQTVQWRL